jgi:hypothetical protein
MTQAWPRGTLETSDRIAREDVMTRTSLGCLWTVALLAVTGCADRREGVLVRTQPAPRAGQGGAQPWFEGERHGYRASLDAHAVEQRLQDPKQYRHVASLAYDPEPHVVHLAPTTPQDLTTLATAAKARPTGEAGEVTPLAQPAPARLPNAQVVAQVPPVPTQPVAQPRVPYVVRAAGPGQEAPPQPGNGVQGGYGRGVVGGGLVASRDDETLHFSGLPGTQGNEVASGGTALGPFALRSSTTASANGGFPTPAFPNGTIANPGSGPGFNTGATFLVVPSDLGSSGGLTGIGAGTATFIGNLGNGSTASVPGGVFANPLAPLAFVGSPTAGAFLFQPGSALAPGSGFSTISGPTTTSGTFAPATLQTTPTPAR